MTRKPLSPWHTLALNNALFAAALHGHLHIVRYLVGDCRADVHAADDGDDLTPFMVAVKSFQSQHTFRMFGQPTHPRPPPKLWPISSSM